ncbi:MAG: ABC transporter ATP-binding protein [Lachnospiraceae bacterium]|nr:ABC transporter ATP-binding protein [Lachnospiraceae bacterium]
MESTIICNSISKQFCEKIVLYKINLNINLGEIFGLLGPSGAGKTTLIKIITGQLMADSGTSSIGGINSKNLQGDDYKGYGIMMDDFGLYERLSCYNNLKIFARIYGIDDNRIYEALDSVGLGYEARKPASKLSKGMKIRLKLAIPLKPLLCPMSSLISIL